MDVNSNYGYVPAPLPLPGSGAAADIPAPVEQAQPVAQPVQQSPGEARATERTNESVDPLRRAVSELNSSIAMYRRHLGIRHHEATNRRIVTVYDSDTNEAIRQIPPESVLDAHASMLEMVGIFMDARG